jgi:AraC-like DNA-binding protein
MAADFRVVRSRLGGVVAVEARTRHVFGRHMHDQFGVGVIEAGAQRSLSGRGTVEAEAGDTITVNPGEVHDGAPVGGGDRAWCMLYFEPSIVFALAKDIGEGKARADAFEEPVEKDPRHADRFRALFRAAIGGGRCTVSALRRDELLLELLAPLLRARERNGAPAAISRLRERIADDPTASPTLADLAAECGLSQFQILRGFRRAFGMAPHAYLVQCRTNLARRLVWQGMPLAEAAFASGFADQSHMTRWFVRSFGASPGAFGRAAR